MGRGSSKAGWQGGGGVSTAEIISTRDMISERASNPAIVDGFLTVSKDMNDLYGANGVIAQFQIADMAPGSTAIAYYDSSNNIAINSKYLNSAQLQSAYDACVSNGFHPSAGGKSAAEAVAAHEFGHALTDAVGQKIGVTGIDAIATRVVNEAVAKSSYKSGPSLASKISKYATYSPAEAIAEAACDVYCNGSKATSASKAIMSVVDGYLK